MGRNPCIDEERDDSPLVLTCDTAFLSSSDGKRSVFALVRRMEAEYDLLFRDACVQQLLHDFQIGPVMLYPDLTIMEINMNECAMDAPTIFPSDFKQLIVSIRVVEDQLMPNPLF